MTKAIHYIGSTPTAILGALEPVTAVIIGVMIFGEKMTPGIVLGILLVLIAVLLVITGRALLNNIRTIHIRHHK
jgi:EamA-like transporter family.